MTEEERRRWSEGADIACAMITQARRSRDWDHFDALARLLGVGDGPEQQGAWEALVDEMSRIRV